MKKPKEGDRCVGVVVEAAHSLGIWELVVPGLIHHCLPDCNNKAFSRAPVALNQICWFEYKSWRHEGDMPYWQPVIEVSNEET
jgi:hypothetical protein